MEFFCYHRDRRGSLPLRMELLESHWAYMDGHAREMIARGPTLSEHGEAGLPTGSVHLLGLPDVAAAREFVFGELGYQAGVYRDVMLRRWSNLLGRTMWEFPGGRTGGTRFLVLGLGLGPRRGGELVLPEEGRDELIAFGPLLSDDGADRLGTVALLRAPDAEAARGVLAAEEYAEVEVHAWQFGGRPAD